MRDYRSTEERLAFTDRMQLVKNDIHTRLKCRNDREGTQIEPVSTHGLNPFADEFEEHTDAPYVINLANGIVRSWLVTEMKIYPHEAVVGIVRPTYPVYEHFHIGLVTQSEEYYDSFGYSRAEMERTSRLKKRLKPMTKSHVERLGIERCGAEAYQAITKEKLFDAGSYQGHTIPNYVTLLENGLDGMLEKIDFWAKKNQRDQETADFYEANRIIVRGMIAYLEQYSRYALELAQKEEDHVQKKYYTEIAENCAFVAHRKPVTLYQAVQLMWCLSM